MNLHITKHAQIRCQQRGIPLEAIEFIYKHGKSINTHQDKKYFCTKKILNRLKYIEKEIIRKFDKYILNTAIVCNEGKLVTAMRITKSIR
jgi:hypothetical protein